MVLPNENMGWGEISKLGRFNLDKSNSKGKEALDELTSRRDCIYNFLEQNYMSCVELVRSHHNEVRLVSYKVSDLAKLIEETDISITKKGIRYLEDNTHREGSLNRELFCIALEQYGNIRQFEKYCRNKPTSR